MQKKWIIILAVFLIALVAIGATVGAVLSIAPSKASVKSMKAVINGPGFPQDYPVENYGFLDNRFYYAAVLPNTENIVILELKFETGTTNVEQSVSRVLIGGAQRSRATDAELEQIYQDATVSTAKYYGDNYVLSKIQYSN